MVASDPFVQVTLLPSQLTARTLPDLEGGSSPEWLKCHHNEIEFPLFNSDVEAVPRLELTVIDAKSPQNSVIGSVTCDLLPFIRTPSVRATEKRTLLSPTEKTSVGQIVFTVLHKAY